MQDVEKGKAVAEAPEVEDPYAADWNDYSQYYDEYDDDDEVCLPFTVLLAFSWSAAWLAHED